jgi:hypothetical protein
MNPKFVTIEEMDAWDYQAEIEMDEFENEFIEPN